MRRPVTALLGPTNTGKTHLALERMLHARERDDRLPAAAAGPRELRPGRRRCAARASVALVTGEERIVPRQPAYWMLHRRGDAARPARRLPGGRRGPARRRPRARPRLHRAHPARARARSETWLDRRRHDAAAAPAAPARRRVHRPAAALDAALRGAASGSTSCPGARARSSPSRCAELYEVAERLRREQRRRRARVRRARRRGRATRRSRSTRRARWTTWSRPTRSAWA